MADDQTKLQSLEGWLDRQNALSDARSRAKPSWWHVGKVLAGFLFVAKGVAGGLSAATWGSGAIAAFFLLGGTSLAYEGVARLRERWAAHE